MAPMMEPMIPAGCRKPPFGSLPKIRNPRKPPTNDPTIPSTIVKQDAHALLSGDDGASDEAGDEADDDEADDGPEHSYSFA